MENKYKVMGMYEYPNYIDLYYYSSYKDLDTAIEEAKWAQAQEDECDYPRLDRDGNVCDSIIVYFNVYLVDEEDNYILKYSTKRRSENEFQNF